MMKLKCQCCGIEAEFVDGEVAFLAGWDAPPHFTGYVCCNLCPAVCIVLNASHAKAHAHWKEHGRPESFGPDCVTNKEWGITQAGPDEQVAGVKAWIEKIEKGSTEQ